MTSISKNLLIDKLADINNTDIGVGNNEKDYKFEVGDHARISTI